MYSIDYFHIHMDFVTVKGPWNENKWYDFNYM